MTEELVTFETAKLAKAKGFNAPCWHSWEFYKYDGKDYGPTALPNGVTPNLAELPPAVRTIMVDRPGLFKSEPAINDHLPQWLYARPTQSLLKRWVREKHGLNVNTYPELGKWEVNVYSFAEKECVYHSGEEEAQETYEAGDELGLKKALKRIK